MALFRPTYMDKKTGEKKQSAMWWIDFTIGDKRIRQSAETTRKTIALEVEKKLRLELERSYAGLPSEPAQRRVSTVGELVQKYLGDYHINHRPQSVAFARNRLAHVRRLLGALLMPSLTEDSIRAYIKDRLAAGVGGRTINMELGELSRALGHKWSVIWPSVRKLEENHEVGQALSAEQETRLLVAAQEESPNRNPVLYLFLCIALSTGMRGGEITALRWSHIDLDSSVVTVTKKAKTKAGAGRLIPINADLRSILEEHQRWYQRKIGEIKPEWCVFPGRAGRPQKGQDRPLDPSKPIRDITTAWDALRVRSGVRCRLHDLRHTAATKMAEAGVPESTMLAIMGHMSRAMLERYSHIRMAAKREAVKSLELPKLGPRAVSSGAMSKERQSKANPTI